VDLLAITRKIWRHRIATLPVIALTLLGAIYVVAIKSPEYWASSSYVLINPPPPPTAEEIAANPALGRIDPDNPYTRFTDQSVVVDLLASKLSNESARDALEAQGADRRYTVAPSSELGFSSVIIEISGVGSTPEGAVRTAELVGAALTAELDGLQASKGVEGRYRIETQRVVAPENAEQRVSGKLRALVGVFAMGAILLFVVISAAEALTTLRTERTKEGVPGQAGNEDASDGAATNASPPHAGSQNGQTKKGKSAGRGRKRRRGRSAGQARNGQAKQGGPARNGQAKQGGVAQNGQAKQGGTAGPERQSGARGAGTKT
jgi:hypothetical protein